MTGAGDASSKNEAIHCTAGDIKHMTLKCSNSDTRALCKETQGMGSRKGTTPTPLQLTPLSTVPLARCCARSQRPPEQTWRQ